MYQVGEKLFHISYGVCEIIETAQNETVEWLDNNNCRKASFTEILKIGNTSNR